MYDRFGNWAFEPVPLERLGLKWPKLKAMQDEAAHLIERHSEATLDVTALEQQRTAARDQDLDAHAHAIRGGAKIPEPGDLAEPALDRKLEGAIRTRDAYERAAAGAIEESEGFKREHAGRLFSDVQQALRAKSRKLSEHARQAAGLYDEVEAVKQAAEKLSPPTPAPSETGPPGSGSPQRLTTYAPGFVMTTGRAAEPDRGEVERVLSYLANIEVEEAG